MCGRNSVARISATVVLTQNMWPLSEARDGIGWGGNGFDSGLLVNDRWGLFRLCLEGLAGVDMQGRLYGMVTGLLKFGMLPRDFPR